MRTAFLFALPALLVAMPAQAAAPLAPGQKLDRALEGRVAGEPVDCINLRRVRSTEVIDDTAILYEIGDTIYLNRPEAGRQSLNRWNAQLTRTHSSQLCSIDVVHMVDPHSGFQTGLVFLGEFVPYRRTERR